MNWKLLGVALVALLIVDFVRSGPTPATEPSGGKDKPSFPVAMLDLTKVYKEHHKFADRAEAMRQDVAAAEDNLKAERNTYQKSLKQLEGLKPGSEDHRQLSEDLKKKAEELNARVKRQKEEFLQQEAAIYSEVFEGINAAVKEYASRRGIKLVLRFNGDPADRTKPDEVLKELNKSVLYQDGIDITNDILEMVNGRG